MRDTIITIVRRRKSISQNITALDLLAHDVINLLYYEHSKDGRKHFMHTLLLSELNNTLS